MLHDNITADWKEAFKSKQEIKKNALNYMIAQIKNKQIEVQRELQDDEIIALLKKEIKWRQESIDFLIRANKHDEVAVEQEIIGYLSVYLPTMMSVEQLTELVKKVIAEQQITDLGKGRGDIVKAIMADHKSVVDGRMLQDIINSIQL